MSDTEDEDDDNDYDDGDCPEGPEADGGLCSDNDDGEGMEYEKAGAIGRDLWQKLRNCGVGGGGDNSNKRFMLIDLEIGTVKHEGTEVVLFGRCEDGRSIVVKATGWHPYFFAQAPTEGWRPNTRSLQDHVRMKLEQKLQSRLDGLPIERRLKMLGVQHSLITSVKDHAGINIMGYTSSPPMRLLKLSVATPSLVRLLRDCFHGYTRESGAAVGGIRISSSGGEAGLPILVPGPGVTYNSNLDSILQFMSDTRISGCEWCSLAAGAAAHDECHLQADGLLLDRDLKWETLEQCSAMAPVRTLSLDIEVAGEKGVFPDANVARWPIIQIAIAFQMEQRPPEQQHLPILLSLKKCDPIDGAIVLCYEDERKLLRAFAEIVSAFDPDVLTGYNINDFDLMYIQNRSGILEVQQEVCGICSRMPWRGLRVERQIFQSAQTGRQVKNKVTLAGRIVVDVFLWVRENYKLDAYSLKAVCAKFLKDENKEDISFTQITPMWEKGAAERRMLGIYCLKDAKLPLLLMQKLSVLFNLVERSRVSRMLPRLYVQKGTMVRFNSQLLPEANAQGFVLPFIEPPKVHPPSFRINLLNRASR